MRPAAAVVLSFASLAAFAAGPVAPDLRTAVEAYVAAHQHAIYRELVALLQIPNVAADRANIRRNAELLRGMLEGRGFAAELLETDGNPLVYGELRVPASSGTDLLYAHYDGQPVDPPRWKQSNPFQPVLRAGRMEDGAAEIPAVPSIPSIPSIEGARPLQDDWRLYARSASDDKAPIVALLTAIDALRAAGRRLGSNLRVVLDGEEEAGSPSLRRAIERHREKIRADRMLILDGPTHPTGRPTLVFGARGNVTLELTVYGPKMALHSGHYGNWVPNPALRLAQLLASMKDDDGRARIAGFYDGIAPLNAEEHAILASVPDDLEGLARRFGIASSDRVGNTLQEALQYPSLNVRGLRSAYVGAEARTIIPSEAIAAIDMRLVRETPSARMVSKVLEHIRKQGFHVVDSEPDDETRRRHPKIVRIVQRNGVEAYRTAMSHPESRRTIEAVTRVWGETPVRIRTSGGTVPISPFVDVLGLPAISVPIVNFDNNQHSENENLRLGHLWRGIVTIAALLE